MGINLQQAVLLETWARRHALQGPVTTLGVQHLDFSARDLAIALGRTPPQSAAHGEAAPADGTMSAAQLFAACGLSGTSAVDIAGSEGADIDFDLNSPELPAQLAGKSRLVVNGGTLEGSGTVTKMNLEQAVGAFEKDLIQDALKTARGNRARAARLLDTTERILGYKVKKYEIDCRRFRG